MEERIAPCSYRTCYAPPKVMRSGGILFSRGYFVMCRECGATGPILPSRTDAIRAWGRMRKAVRHIDELREALTRTEINEECFRLESEANKKRAEKAEADMDALRELINNANTHMFLLCRGDETFDGCPDHHFTHSGGIYCDYCPRRALIELPERAKG